MADKSDHEICCFQSAVARLKKTQQHCLRCCHQLSFVLYLIFLFSLFSIYTYFVISWDVFSVAFTYTGNPTELKYTALKITHKVHTAQGTQGMN